MDIPDNLSGLKRRELQALCKSRNIKANMKNADMIKALQECMDKQESTEASARVVEPHTVESEAESVNGSTESGSAPTTADGTVPCLPNTSGTVPHLPTLPTVTGKSVIEQSETGITSEAQSDSDRQTEPYSCCSPPRSHTGDVDSVHESDVTSEVMMDISIKVNIGSPLLSRDQCVGENELETNDTEGEEETAEHISSPDKSGSESSPGTNTGTCVHSSSPPKPSMAKENHTTTTPSTTTCICTSTANTGSDYQLAMPPCSPSDQPMPGATPTGDDGGEEGDKLNKTFTIESPEKDMSEGTTDPLAALNESLTLTSSSKQTDVTPLRGCWLTRTATSTVADSPLTINKTFVKSPPPLPSPDNPPPVSDPLPLLRPSDSEGAKMEVGGEGNGMEVGGEGNSMEVGGEGDKMEVGRGGYKRSEHDEAVVSKEDKENTGTGRSHHEEIMALLDSRVNSIISDPAYVSEVKASGVPSSRIPVKKGSISAKFNQLHNREFNKMESIDTTFQNRKRRLEASAATDGPVLHSSKKSKIEPVVKPNPLIPKKSTISKSAIDRLSTPKHMQSKKKVFTNTPKISAKKITCNDDLTLCNSKCLLS